MTPITIGIPYLDEGQDFDLLAGGLSQTLDALPPNLPREVVVCVNGSGDEFAGLLEARVAASPLSRHGARVITSSEGKLVAQQAIVESRSLDGYLAFVDSDVVLEPNVLHRLWETLEADADCMVSYGQPVAVFPDKGNTVHLLLRTHYSLRERAYHRVYFHGRAFMMRRWFLELPTATAVLQTKVAVRLRLHKGPLVDDIVLSRIAVARWGPEVIREVQEANVYFDPPDTVRGLYAAHLRVALELARLDLLYPEHAQLQNSVFSATWRPDGIRRFSMRLRALHACYRLLDAALRRAAQAHMRMVKAGLLDLDTLWVCVPGTKNFARHRHSWRNFKQAGASSKPPETR